MGQSRLILLDTHVVLWLAFEPHRISAKAQKELEHAELQDEEFAICDISLLELATMEAKRRFEATIGFESFLKQVVERFTILPITVQACSMIPKLPSNYPKDPADRIIGATAWAKGIPLVTADRKILTARAFPTIW